MSATRFARVANRLFNAPLAIRAEKAEMLVAALAHRLGVAQLSFADGREPLMIADLDEMAMIATDGDRPARKIYDVSDSVAIIPVEGTLVHKLGTVDAWSGMMGYDGLAFKLRAAIRDPDVQAIWLDVDSPGGEVAGCFDFADELASCTARMGGKPIWAFINEAAYSAAYAIASQCDRVITPRTGGCGSVGVLTMHVDFSAALKKDGINPTLIFSGAHKVDGNEIGPLPQAVLDRVQQSLDTTRLLFAGTVARGRSLLIDDVLATEAECFDGDEAIDVGFADAVMCETDAFNALLDTL